MPAPLIEFPADDPDRARRFWRGVLGVTLAPRPAEAGSGWETDTDGLRLGVHERGPGPGDTASLPYFTVSDLATTLERVRDLGGSVIHPGDRWAVCRDSEGSPFALAARPVPDWTKTNFDDLRDVSPEHVRIQWRFAREALGSPELGVSRFTYEPGARMPWGHRHRQQEEAYVVIGGSGRAKLGDEIIELRVSDVLRVAPAVVRSFEAGPDGLDVICIGGRRPEGGDSERFEDFWA